MSKKSFNIDDLVFLKSLIKELSENKRARYIEILDKLDKIEKQMTKRALYKVNHIAQKREEDKFYARGYNEIQSYFVKKFNKIKKLLQDGKSVEARYLYNSTITEAQLPKYEQQFNEGIKCLTEEEIKFLEK